VSRCTLCGLATVLFVSGVVKVLILELCFARIVLLSNNSDDACCSFMCRRCEIHGIDVWLDAEPVGSHTSVVCCSTPRFR
jgi:hypothetical protein